jgi:lysozyme
MNVRRLALSSVGLVATLTLCACAADSQQEEPLAAGSSELSGCVPTTLTGVDVSTHNEDVDWAKVKSAGKSFSFARTSDGLTGIDDKFASNWPAMKRAGLVRGAYQFFRARHHGVEQAQVMLKQLADAGGLQKGDLPPVLDLETADKQTAANVVARAKEWLAYVESQIGVKPILYTGNNMSNIIGTNFKDYVLWVPHYQVECPRIPAGWTNWTFWQDAEDGKVAGISGKGVDTDFFQGRASDLAALTMTHSVAHLAEDFAVALPPPAAGGGAAMGDGLRGQLDD